jgi:hypothetical protein
MTNLDKINPVDFIYLNPELNLTTVEESYSYWDSYGKDLGLYSNINLPSDFHYDIYIYLNDSVIKSNLSDLYNTYITSDPERLGIIHQTRCNQNNQYQYSIPSDFEKEIFKTFNSVTVSHLTNKEYYLEYLARSNEGSLTSSNLGTVSDFMGYILDSSFSTGYTINSDLQVNGTTNTTNITITDTLNTFKANISNAVISVLEVDTIIVTDTSYIESIFKDEVKLYSNLYVLGSNAIINNELQTSNLIVLNSSTFCNNVELKSTLTVTDITTLNSNLIVNSNLYVVGYSYMTGNVELNKLIINDSSTFNNDSTFNSNIIANSNIEIEGITTLNSNLIVNKESTFNDKSYFKSDIEIDGTSIFNNNIQINSNIILLSNLWIGNNLNIVNDSSFSNNVIMSSNLTVLKTGYFDSLQITTNVSISNNLTVSSNILASEFITLSDRRIKKNIEDLKVDKAKYLINKMNVKEYNLLNSNKKNIGLIAQDIEPFTNQLINKLDNYTININQNVDKIVNNVYKMPLNLLSDGDIIIYSNNEDDKYDNYTGIVSLIGEDKFSIKNINENVDIMELDNTQIYIKDRIILNFKSINYIEIIMLCVSCIQDIYKILSK